MINLGQPAACEEHRPVFPSCTSKVKPADTWEVEKLTIRIQASWWPSVADGHQNLLVKVIKKSWIVRLIISEKIKSNPWRLCAILTAFLGVLPSLLVRRRTLIKSEMKSVRSHAASRQHVISPAGSRVQPPPELLNQRRKLNICSRGLVLDRLLLLEPLQIDYGHHSNSPLWRWGRFFVFFFRIVNKTKLPPSHSR